MSFELVGAGMESDNEDVEIWAERMLRRIGWHESEWAQIEAYARMSPARKITQMLWLRHEQVALLRKRLWREHPDCTDAEIAYMVLEHLDMLKEDRTEK